MGVGLGLLIAFGIRIIWVKDLGQDAEYLSHLKLLLVDKDLPERAYEVISDQVVEIAADSQLPQR